MILPNESLLVALRFADYATLVLAKLTGKRFLRLVTKFAAELSFRRHRFEVTFYNGDDICFSTHIKCTDLTIGAQRRIGYEPGKQPSLVAACRELAEMIGSHVVATLTIPSSMWSRPDAGVIFEAALPLKYAEEVVLSSDRTVLSSINRNVHRNYIALNPLSCAFMSNFPGVYSEQLWPYLGKHHRVSWTFRLVTPILD